MSNTEIQQVELELAGLQQDDAKLTELRTKYEADFAAAEAAWRGSRAPKDLDAMVKAKGLLDTVSAAQRDQGFEIAKVSTYLNVIREQHQLDLGITAVADNQLARLTELQSEFGSRMAALEQHMASELLALDEMRVEWDGLHRQAWGELFGLGLTAEQVKQRFANRGLDLTPLKLRVIPSSGQVDRTFEQKYEFPLRKSDENDPRSKAEAMVIQSVARWIHGRQIAREEEEYRRGQAERASQRQHWLSRSSGEL